MTSKHGLGTILVLQVLFLMVFSLAHAGTEGTLKWYYQHSDPPTQVKAYDYGDFISTPAIGSDGTIYVGSHDGSLNAISHDGLFKWSCRTGDFIESSPAVGSDGTIYIGSNDNYLYAVNSNGTLKWRYQTGGMVRSSPAIGAEGTVYLPAGDGYLYAIDSTGALKWRYLIDSAVQLSSSPAVANDGTVYVGDGSGSLGHSHLTALAASGALKWSYDAGHNPGTTYSQGVTSSPAIGSDGTIYVGSNDSGYLYAISSSGVLKWKYLVGKEVVSSPALASDGTVYVVHEDDLSEGNLYAIDSSGALKWKYKPANTGLQEFASPAVAKDGSVYVAGWDGHVYAVGSDGAQKWSCQIDRGIISSPVLGADGTIYINSVDGYLYAINGTAGPAYPWSMFRHDAMHTGVSTSASFADVPTGSVYFPFIDGLAGAGLTKGCGNGNFCPNGQVTRGQMAAFIERSLHGENFDYPLTPYFSDVPSDNVYFKYVQRLKSDGITAVTGTYNVNDYVTRGQMAAFLVRTLFGEIFSYTTAPYFSDVPGSNMFFKYVQKLKDAGVTASTGAYNVDNNVTREQMAAFLGRSFLDFAHHKITGKVTDSAGVGIPGVTVMTDSGDYTRKTTTKADGTYTLTGVTNGGYTLSASLNGYVFGPQTVYAVVNNGDAAGKDFVGAKGSGFTISGKVAFWNNFDGVPSQDMVISSAGDYMEFVQTGATGYYAFAALPPGTYTIHIGFLVGRTKESCPQARTVTVTNADVKDIDFTLGPSGSCDSSTEPLTTFSFRAKNCYQDQTYALQLFDDTASPTKFWPEGTVGYQLPFNTVFTQSLSCVVGHRICIGGEPQDGDIWTPGINGHKDYLMWLYNYEPACYVCGDTTLQLPVSLDVFKPVNMPDWWQAARECVRDGIPGSSAFYYITGRVVDAAGNPLPGVTISLDGTNHPAYPTNDDGSYVFTVNNGDYTVTPSLGGYTFAPQQAAANVAGADLHLADFIATAISPGDSQVPKSVRVGFGTASSCSSDWSAYGLGPQFDFQGNIDAAGKVTSKERPTSTGNYDLATNVLNGTMQFTAPAGSGESWNVTFTTPFDHVYQLWHGRWGTGTYTMTFSSGHTCTGPTNGTLYYEDQGW